ncbi:hypothetical protein ACFQ2B_39535 [Streptomyces stramineus]
MTAAKTGAIGVIGAGAVGQGVAMLLAAGGWCESVRVVSRSGLSAQALVTDLEDMCQVIGSPSSQFTSSMRDSSSPARRWWSAQGPTSPTPPAPTCGWPGCTRTPLPSPPWRPRWPTTRGSWSW